MCTLDIEPVQFEMSDEDYADWRETMHVDPFEVLDDFPTLVSEDDANE